MRFGNNSPKKLGPSLSRAGYGRKQGAAHLDPWTITLDIYTVHIQHTHVSYTRMRAPFINPDNFRFSIYRKGVFSELGKLLGMQDIEVGDPEFDEAFIIKGNARDQCREIRSANPEPSAG